MRETQKFPCYLSFRDDLIRFIPPHAKRILEVKCAGGQTGKALRERGFEEIVGIEVNEEVAERGRSYDDELMVGDVQKIQIRYEKEHYRRLGGWLIDFIGRRYIVAASKMEDTGESPFVT
jgi:hypothetical protein